MRYSIGFMSGFSDGDFSAALAVDGDEATLTLTKGAVFNAWLTEDWRIKLLEGPVGEVPAWVMNRKKVHELVDAWLDGVEFEG